MLNDSSLLDRTFQALADPTRRGMLARLSRGPASVSDLARPLAMTLPAVLQHIQALEQSGLVKSEKKGRVRTVAIETTAMSAAERWFAEQRSVWEARTDRLEDYLATLQNEGEKE